MSRQLGVTSRNKITIKRKRSGTNSLPPHCPRINKLKQKVLHMVFVVLAVIIAGVAIIGGGNTVSGFGRDVENTGEKVQDAAD